MRSTLLSLAVLATSLSATAAAQECMETSQIVPLPGLSGISIDEPRVDVLGAPQSIDPAVAEELRRSWDRAGYEHLRADGGAVLWCYTPDDPRCNPVDAPARAPQLLRTQGKATTTVPFVPDAPSRPMQASHDDSRPHSGVKSRVERPPRA
jgi:hypothetical protein